MTMTGSATEGRGDRPMWDERLPIWVTRCYPDASAFHDSSNPLRKLWTHYGSAIPRAGALLIKQPAVMLGDDQCFDGFML
jgi:hypothetical protein